MPIYLDADFRTVVDYSKGDIVVRVAPVGGEVRWVLCTRESLDRVIAEAGGGPVSNKHPETYCGRCKKLITDTDHDVAFELLLLTEEFGEVCADCEEIVCGPRIAED